MVSPRQARHGVHAGGSKRPSSHLEREVKLEAGLRFTLPDLTGVLPGVVVKTLPDAKLQATYIDTKDLRLMRWGITLRYRRDVLGGPNAESGWTLKLPAAADGVALVRRELLWPGKLGPVPAEVASLVRAVARTAPLEPVAKLTTLRRRVELWDSAGRRLAEVDDDVVSVMDGRKLAARFREVEVELTPAAPPDRLDAVVDRLTAAGAVPGDDRPKVVRAIGSRATLGPDVVVPELGPEATVAEVVAASIASGVTRIIRHDPGVRLGDDPEHVHQARVGTRRLRSDLRTFRPLLDVDWTSSVRAELGWLGGALGEVRDADVLTQRLQAQIATLPDVDQRPATAILRRLGNQRDEARGRLLEVLSSERYVVLLEELARAAADPPLVAATATLTADTLTATTDAAPIDTGARATIQPAPTPAPAKAVYGAAEPALSETGTLAQPTTPTMATGGANGNGAAGGLQPVRQLEASKTVPLGERPAREILPRLVRPPWKHVQRAVDALGDDPPDTALHEVRIRAKRIRYAAEAAAGVIGKPARRLAAAVAELQGVLGDLQDAVVAEGWLRRVAASASPGQALVAGELVSIQSQQQRECRAAWAAAWKAASAKRLRSWLKG
jgi:CHAD domain-containing protein